MKEKNVAAVLALFLGLFGVHKFYLGRIGMGVVYLLLSWTGLPILLSGVDFLVLMLTDEKNFNDKYNGGHQLSSPVVVNMLGPGGQGYPPGGYHPAPPPVPPGYRPGYQPYTAAPGYVAPGYAAPGYVPQGYVAASPPPGYAPPSAYVPSQPQGYRHPGDQGQAHQGQLAPAPVVDPSTDAGIEPTALGKKLEQLNELRVSGLLTEEEFAAQKARLLA